MFTHCIFCRASLGANDVIEALPIGRRVAFDAAKGRLWVVCPACGQWNLTPFEERWEAVETAERLYRDTRRRVQGNEVGLARLKEGLELVRIGKPQRPEFAAWRYGDQFGRRRRQTLTGALLGAGTVGAVVVAGPLLGVSLAGALTTLSLVSNVMVASRVKLTHQTLLDHPDGRRLLITINERANVRLAERPASEGGWGLDVPYQRVAQPDESWWKRHLNLPSEGVARFNGPDALRIADRLVSKSNGFGIGKRQIESAVSLVEDAGGPEQWFRYAATQTRRWGAEQTWGDTGAIAYLPKPVRLALEMAAHEETERRALEGELAALEGRWREAEQIAAIADDLLLPASVTSFLARVKGRTRG